ncbi:unnamed protein product [Penicillium salamii]|uniref:DUF1275 domain protein n=1 Tax=Penicillium salamii TaxID=1612424 RepID=A0A9W4K488_9EURO|nr:unnamed protein product [Penicillium salamii]CAG8247420.1 unnamed protein product [Penicillium salamii]CAG8289681.1 unnamed protein product [Penicillium salamii]CAG8319654.1 unnamed protein product [Penicillium salamii]CAG8400928.1 unnamed protein product [Penicillium salamii]
MSPGYFLISRLALIQCFPCMGDVGIMAKSGSLLKKTKPARSDLSACSTPPTVLPRLIRSVDLSINSPSELYISTYIIMHNQPPSPSDTIAPIKTITYDTPDSPQINPNDLTAANFRLETTNDETKYTPGLWSSGGSTAVSLSGNQTQDENSMPATLSRHFRANIDTTHTDIILVVCGFVGGLVDGLSFNAWGSFSSMQTGNTVFLALGVSGQPAYPAYLWAKSLIAITVFIVSNIFFIHMHRFLNPRRRSTMIISFGIQTIAILIAAILVQLGVILPKPEDPRAPIEWMQILPISLLSFQAGGQICASRILGFDEIPTVVVTTLLCDLLVDPKLTAKGNPRRNRRIGAFLALFFGAMTAGGLSKATGMASSLWFAMGLKLTITLGWFVWKREGRRKSDVDV